MKSSDTNVKMNDDDSNSLMHDFNDDVDNESVERQRNVENGSFLDSNNNFSNSRVKASKFKAINLVIKIEISFKLQIFSLASCR